MRLLRPIALFGLTFIALGFSISASASAQLQKAESYDLRPAPLNCPVTLPTAADFTPPYPVPRSSAAQFGLNARGKFGTEKLWTVVPIDGVWSGRIPRKLGEYVYSDKHPWFRVHPAFSSHDGPLTVTGKRLDGPAPSFIESYVGGVGLPDDDDNAMIMGAIQIPVFGCWRITGTYADQELSFVVWVAPRSPQETDSAIRDSQARSIPHEHAQRVHVDGDVQAKSLVYSVRPEIPHEAEVANIHGPVVLKAVIDRNGRPTELQYLSGPPLLARPAIDAVVWWQYMITEKPVEVETTIEVEFPPDND